MKEITQILNGYRECVRHLWNTYFIIKVSSNQSWDLLDEYDEICKQLFNSLVLSQIDGPTYNKAVYSDSSPEPLLFFRVEPIVETGIPLHVSREKENVHYWDYPITQIKSGDADMRFIDYFDFDLFGFRDFQYCRVRIINSTVYPELIGHDALIVCSHIRIYFDDVAQ